MGWFTSRNYPKYLLGIFLVLWAISLIGIKFPFDFFLEHILTVVFLAFLIFSYHKFRLSNISYTLIFCFMLLHVLGAHYTYSLVPYDKWSEWLFKMNITELFGFSRNHYDRLVHLSFGLLMAYPVREVFLRIASVKGIWGYYLPLDVMASFSVAYELLEFAIAVIIGGAAAATYNGEQGDVWDAHKDMFMAICGGIISMTTIFFVNMRYKKDFWRDIKQSFSIKRKTPLGEVELLRMQRK